MNYHLKLVKKAQEVLENKNIEVGICDAVIDDTHHYYGVVFDGDWFTVYHDYYGASQGSLSVHEEWACDNAYDAIMAGLGRVIK